VVTIGTINGGTASNIIADEVKMSGTLRALDMSVMRRLKQIIKQTCEEMARGYGAEAEVVFTTESPVLNSAPALTEFTMDRIRALIGSDRVFQLDAPSLGADDFAFFCEATDCCYFNIGCRGDGQGDDQILHTPALAPDEGCIRNTLEILCQIAL
jgi:metal-dependent amidase/aminoacylase/carboxypeptidase family protein